VAFALWTLCSHAVVAAGGTLRWLIFVYAVAAGALVAGLVRAHRAGRLAADSGPVAAPPTQRPRALQRAQIVGLALGIASTFAVVTVGSPILAWWTTASILLGAAVVFLVLEAPVFLPARGGRRLEIGLAILATLCVLYTLAAHRPDADDAFYVNLAVGAVDRPDLPLLATDTLHGRDDLPIHISAYRLHSYELLCGAVALLTGIPAIYVFHWIAASAAAAFIPLSHAALFRLLLPRLWLAATTVLVIVLASVGETHRWYGNFAFVRIWQGKGILLFVFLPLVCVQAIRFAKHPSARGWLLLAAAQVSALGCSANAIWTAPGAAIAAMACVLRPRKDELRRFAIGATASLYVLAAGVLVKRAMPTDGPALQKVYESGSRLADAFTRTLGDSWLQAVGIGAISIAWACSRRGLAQRFAIAIPLFVTLVLLDPYTEGWVRANVTGPSYWRSLWLLPIPILITLVLIAPLQWEGAPWMRRAGIAATCVLTLAFALFVPSHPGFDTRNGVRLSWPSLKVEDTPRRWARLLNEAAPRARVVAPPGISAWVPTFHDHAYPLMVRTYLGPNRHLVGEMAYRDRYVMTHFAAGEQRHPQAEAIFARGLELYDVEAVCLRNSDLAETAREILRESGYRRRVQGTDHEIWVRA
jgi:hypothetical protein